MKVIVAIEAIQHKIFLVRGQKVMVDSDLADLYEVEVKQLKRQVRRNIDRFPSDFMFEVSRDESEVLRRQFGALKRGEHSKYRSYVFTEPGVAMLSGVLHSRRAVQVNIAIMRAFVSLRKMISEHHEIARKIAGHERKIRGLTADVQKILELIHPLIDGPARKLPRIGFDSD
jgi:hypothetical protein